MSIVDRAKNIILRPSEEWKIIAGEPATIGGLFSGYAVILALIPLVSAILFNGVLGISAAGMTGLGDGGMSMGLTAIAGMALVSFILSLITLYLMGTIVNIVSPSFNGTLDKLQAMKLMTYASTPTWLVALISWIPFLGALVTIAAIAYVVYLIYLGLNPVLGVPQEKVAGFTVVIVLIYIVLALIISGIIVGLVYSMFFGNPMMGGALSGA
ncbi:Yip1 family protein [Sphingorhabdus sp.]|uniref:Yip1 family protein n=1 Tax=Sphingorhabdus sp. TaxID=1902408 RepID=UPI00391B49F4